MALEDRPTVGALVGASEMCTLFPPCPPSEKGLSPAGGERYWPMEEGGEAGIESSGAGDEL